MYHLIRHRRECWRVACPPLACGAGTACRSAVPTHHPAAQDSIPALGPKSFQNPLSLKQYIYDISALVYLNTVKLTAASYSVQPRFQNYSAMTPAHLTHKHIFLKHKNVIISSKMHIVHRGIYIEVQTRNCHAGQKYGIY
jgi:hypothetical protein